MDKNTNSINPLISIITVTYNSEKYLEGTIKSIVSQSCDNIEYIIIDGGSTDKTIEIINNNLDTISYWTSEPDEGIYDAMNKGIEVANGEIIGIINSDDWLEPDALENVLKISENITDDQFLIHGNIATIDKNGNFVGNRYPKKFPLYHLFSTPFKHPATFVSRSVYENIGLYAEDCGLAADYDFMLRVINNRIKTIHLDKVLTNVRLVGISTGGKQNASFKQLFSIIKNNTNVFLASLGILGRYINKKISK
ncbi:MAG: glycosyltransferase family 2 protein [Candidatus Paceibacterota bacterium]